MPPADFSIEDFGAMLIRGAADERAQWRNEAKTHHANREEAQRIDNFSQELMRKQKSEDAIQWVNNGNHTWGEKSSGASKRLVEKLRALGCRRIIACEIESYDDDHEHTEHVVVELPEERPARAQKFDFIDGLYPKAAIAATLTKANATATSSSTVV